MFVVLELILEVLSPFCCFGGFLGFFVLFGCFGVGFGGGSWGFRV